MSRPASRRDAPTLAQPGEYRALAPLVVREIVYRLLTGAQGSRMHHLALCGGHAHRTARAVERLRENFDKPLRIETIARELGMSVSGFHARFKAVTSMSPLQFQKQVRLQEARWLTALWRTADAGRCPAKRIGGCDRSSLTIGTVAASEWVLA